MRRRQCKNCDCKRSHDASGAVVRVKEEKSVKLPGLRGNFDVRRYTVECAKCGRMWTYRRKIK